MLEKAERLQIEKDTKDKEAKRLALEKAQIEALIEKYGPCTPKTPDKVNTTGTGKNANINGQKGIEKEKPPHKKAMKASQIKTFQERVIKPKKAIQIHCLVIPWLIPKHIHIRLKKKGKKIQLA